MSVRIRAAVAAIVLASCLVQTPVLAQMGNQLTAEEQVAAQNFNGIDIVGDSLGTPANLNSTAAGQGFNQSVNGSFNNSTAQSGLSTNLNSQNTQLGHVNAFGMNNGGMNNVCSNGMNGMSSMNSMIGMNQTNGMNGNNSMSNGFNNGMNNGIMQGGMMQNNGMMQNSGMNNGFATNDMSGAGNGGIVQSIGNTIMNDPKMMQRAVGVAGAAALFGLFVTNGGVGGMMRSAGMDNTRHIRGSVVGY
jgi:hypothetical protein